MDTENIWEIVGEFYSSPYAGLVDVDMSEWLQEKVKSIWDFEECG